MLQLQSLDDRDLCVDLDQVRLNIGRDSSNELVLEDPSISGFHATIFAENGRVEVIDVGSTNGTWLNGSRVEGRTALKPWDRLRFGFVELEVADPVGRKPTSVQPAVQVSAATSPASAPSNSLLATLLAVSPGLVPAHFEIYAATTVGRDSGNSLVLNHPTVSSRHAEIKEVGGSLELIDLGSTNGTWVNGQRIQWHILQHGDRVRFDEIEFTVDLPRPAAAATIVNPAVKAAPAPTVVNPAVSPRPASPIVQEPIVQEPIVQEPIVQEPIVSPPPPPRPAANLPPAASSAPVVPAPVSAAPVSAAPAPTAGAAATVVEQAVKPPQPMAPPKLPAVEDFSFAVDQKQAVNDQRLVWLLFSFQGRIGRMKYFLSALMLGLIVGAISCLVQFLLLGEVAAFDIYSPRYANGLVLHWIVSLVLAGWPALALAVKRFHDQNRSGHWLWLGLVPIANLVVSIMLLFVAGTDGENRFGSKPQ